MNIIDSGKELNGQKVGYSIDDNGYSIYLDNKLWITQPEPYANLYVANGSYEDNAKAQIEELTTPVEPQPTTEDRVSDLEDYTADILYQVCLLQLGVDDTDNTGKEIETTTTE